MYLLFWLIDGTPYYGSYNTIVSPYSSYGRGYPSSYGYTPRINVVPSYGMGGMGGMGMYGGMNHHHHQGFGGGMHHGGGGFGHHHCWL